MSFSHRCTIASLFLLLIAMPVVAQESSVDVTLAAAYFEEARTLSSQDRGRLWGRPLYGPMMFANPQTREVVANEADAEGNLKPHGGVFTGRLPEATGIANTAVRWAGVEWTMIMWPLPRDRQDRARLMVHELFHRIQDELGLPGLNPANLHLDSRDGRIWLQLEWRALERALWETGAARRQAIADALTFRRFRRSLFKTAALEENQLEVNEGLAEYTGAKLGTSSSREAVAVALCTLRQARYRPSFVRSFAYVSGPGYGSLLDEVDPRWRKKLSSESDLGALLARRLRLDVNRLSPAQVVVRARAYDGQTLIADETKKDDLRQAQLRQLRSRYLEQAVLILPLSSGVNYTYDPNNVVALDEVGTVYPKLRVSDGWGVIEVSNGALMIRENGAVKFLRVPVPANKDARPLEGDGWKLELKPGWQADPAERPGDLVLKNVPSGTPG